MMKKLKVDDKELEAGQDELWKAIRKALGKTVTNMMAKKEESEDEQMGEDDEGYETVS
jgi:hypothetical protein